MHGGAPIKYQMYKQHTPCDHVDRSTLDSTVFAPNHTHMSATESERAEQNSAPPEVPAPQTRRNNMITLLNCSLASVLVIYGLVYVIRENGMDTFKCLDDFYAANALFFLFFGSQVLLAVSMLIMTFVVLHRWLAVALGITNLFSLAWAGIAFYKEKDMREKAPLLVSQGIYLLAWIWAMLSVLAMAAVPTLARRILPRTVADPVAPTAAATQQVSDAEEPKSNV